MTIRNPDNLIDLTTTKARRLGQIEAPPGREGTGWYTTIPLAPPGRLVRYDALGHPVKIDWDGVAYWLIRESGIKWMTPRDRGLWVYHPTEQRWVRGEDAVAPIIQRIALIVGKSITTERMHRPIANIIMALTSYEDGDILNHTLDPDTIICRDGTMSLDDLELNPHSPDDKNTILVPTYVGWEDRYLQEERDEAVAIRDGFLNSILPNQDDQEAFLCMAGLCLLRSMPVQKFFVLLGSGANGKSTALGWLTDILGRDNVANESIQSLADNRFAVAALEGKLANICPDIPSTRLSDTSVLKALTGGDRMRAERKYQPGFSFQSFATPIFSANTLPAANDYSAAFYRRFHIIKFTECFTDREDRSLCEQLARPAVHTAMLHRMIEALRDCRDRGWTLPMSDGAHAEIKNYELSQDSVLAWSQERVLIEPSAITLKDAIYTDYVDWATDAHVGIVQRNTFFRRMSSLPGFVGASETRPGPDNTRQRALRGIRLLSR